MKKGKTTSIIFNIIPDADMDNTEFMNMFIKVMANVSKKMGKTFKVKGCYLGEDI